jgi:hypothetical protein
MNNDRPCVITNVCKGCLTYMTRLEQFGSRDAQCSLVCNANNCPCTICIIKSMCAKECEAFIEYKQRELP